MASPIKIHVDVETLPVEVNKNGDILNVPISDERFIQKLINFVTVIQKEAEGLEETDDTNYAIEQDIKFHSKIKDEFDILFGSGSYEIVFGKDMLIGAEYILDFITALMPHIEKNSQKRLTKMNKYNANRVGSSV